MRNKCPEREEIFSQRSRRSIILNMQSGSTHSYTMHGRPGLSNRALWAPSHLDDHSASISALAEARMNKFQVTPSTVR